MATKTPRTRTTRTKAEVKADFDEVSASVKSAEALPAKEAELKASRDAATRKAVEDFSPEAITQKVTAAQFAINRTLASVQEQLVQQTQELETVKQAVTLERAELDRMHGADKVLTALDVLVQEYEDKQEQLEASYQLRNQSVTDEITKIRLAWTEEQTLHNKQLNERKAELEKNRIREQQDYDYNTQVARKQHLDKFQEEIRLQQAAERDRKEAQEKLWTQRESDLAAKETEFATLKAQVDSFPAKLDAETKKAEAIVGNSVKREYEHKIQLITKDAESQQKVLDMQIVSLNTALTKSQETIAELQLRLKDSENNVRSIAEKALDSASSTRTLAEVRTMMPHESNGGSRSKA